MAVQQESVPRVRFRPRRLGHANLFVGDLDRSMRFYNEVCGLEEVFRERGIDAGFLSNGNTHHDVGMIRVSGGARVGRDGHVQIAAGRGSRAGLNHLGFEMENEAELVEAYRRARQAGVKIHRTTDHQLAHSVYLFDPEGNLLEFYADVTEDWRGVFRPDGDELISGSWTPGEPHPLAEPRYPVSPKIARVADAIFHPLRITHAALVVRDFEKALRFYSDVAGLDRVVALPGGAFATLRGRSTAYALALFPATAERPLGLHHIGFEMADERELDDAEARLKAAGIAPEVRLDHPTKRSIFVSDPDGIRCEFFVARSVPSERVGASDKETLPYLA